MDDTREKIILLEPDTSAADALVAVLQSAGYEVSAFPNSADALDAAHRSAPDLLLLDFPAINPSAREMLATIRGASTTATSRVILLVGPETWQRTAALEYGADDAISRPWES